MYYKQKNAWQNEKLVLKPRKYNKQTDLLKATASKLTLINLQPNIKGWVMNQSILNDIHEKAHYIIILEHV